MNIVSFIKNLFSNPSKNREIYAGDAASQYLRNNRNEFPDTERLSFTVIRATGGFIVETRSIAAEGCYNRGPHTSIKEPEYKVYIIPNDKNFIEEMSKIITLCLLTN